MTKKSKSTAVKTRSDVALAALQHPGAGPQADRRTKKLRDRGAKKRNAISDQMSR